MTFKKFEELFKQKYPNGQVWMHDEFEHGVPGKRQKVGVVFDYPNGKVYMYAGAYEDILCKAGINCISKERFASRVNALQMLQEQHGKQDEFFGFIFDNSKEIATLKAEIEEYRTNWIIA